MRGNNLSPLVLCLVILAPSHTDTHASDSHLLDNSPEQCLDPGQPLHPLLCSLSPLPPHLPLENSQQLLHNQNIPPPKLQGTETCTMHM